MSYRIKIVNTMIMIMISVIGLSFCAKTDNPASANTPTVPDTTAPNFSGLTSATVVSSTQIDLTWSAATDNVTASGSIVYDIYQATVSGGESYTTASFSSTAGVTSYSVTTGLTAGTQYFFVVRARDTAGNRDLNSFEKSATTIAPVYPGIPTSLTVTARSASSISFSWGAASGSPTGYKVYRSGTTGGTLALLGTVIVTNYVDSGLTATTNYYYKVASNGIDGENPTKSSELAASTYTRCRNYPTNVTNTTNSITYYGVSVKHKSPFSSPSVRA